MPPEGFTDDVRFEPYWWEDAPPPAPIDLPLRPAVDVVVVGAGYAGLNAALTLSRAGRSCLVLDAHAPGWGASTRNGGQVGPGNQKFTVDELLTRFGEAKARALFQEGLNAFSHISDLIKNESIDCAFRRCGRFRGASRPGHYEQMARNMDAQRRFAGVESFMVPREDQHREINSDRYHGGSVLPDDAVLHPGLYHRGLLERAQSTGAIVAGEMPVHRIERNSVGFHVHTPRMRLHAGNVIIATNGYTGTATPALRKRIVPVPSAIIATEPLPVQLVNTLIPAARVYGETRRVFNYFRASPDGRRIVFGGRGAHWLPSHTARAYVHLRRDLLRTFPDLRDYTITHCWRGNVAMTFDMFPHLGCLDGIHYALGCNGTGVSRTSYLGHRIALQVLGDPDGHTAFDDLGFPAHRLYRGNPWMVPLVEAGHRLRDLVDR